MQRRQQKQVNTFIKGLNTEFNELTFPPDASVDELNCDLRRDGSRRRRLGLAYEPAFALSSFTKNPGVVTTGTWLNVGGQAGLEYLVVQTGASLRFYNKSTRPYSEKEVSGSVDLSAYETATGGGASNSKATFASINGMLIVTSSAIKTILVTRDNTAGTIASSEITFRVRDFERLSVYSNLDNEVSTSSVTDERKYDTYNSGWQDDELDTYKASRTAWPPLTHPWFSGKDVAGDFSVSEFRKIGAVSSITANGRFILDFFSMDRAAKSGIPGLAAQPELSRFTCSAAFFGRVFYAGLNSARNSGKILFSRIIERKEELGECFQKNSPTSEFYNDLLDTDGGVISIPDCVGIKVLHAFSNYLFVLADNGIWQISGIDGFFSPSSYSVSKISDVGIATFGSFVSYDGVPFWWSKYGIHTISIDSTTSQATEQNISLNTVQTFWDEIGLSERSEVFSAYDKINKKLYWFYPKLNETVQGKITKALILDINLQSFYPWEIAESTNYAVGAAFYSGYGADDLTLDVVVGTDNPVVGVDEIQVTELNDYATGDPSISLLVIDGATSKFTVAEFTDSTFVDWGTEDYSSFAVTGHDFQGDLLLQKNAPFVTVYTRVTEEGWSGSEATGYNPLNESSLLVSAYWDFQKNPSSSPQQAYRLLTTPVVDPGALGVFDYNSTVVTTRLKLRGRGRSLRIKFESEPGKNFILLGYSMLGEINDRE
jgi:hypothetical protein